MNIYEPVSSGFLAAVLHDAAFDGTLLRTLASELGRLVPQHVVISILSRHRRDGGLRTIIHPAHSAGPMQRMDKALVLADRAVEGWVYSGECDGTDTDATVPETHVRLVLRSSRRGRIELELRFPTRKADQLRPHLSRMLQSVAQDLVLAFRINDLRERVATMTRLNDALMELLPLPVLLLDRRGGLQRSNARGAALMAQADAIVAGADGRIHAATLAANAGLHAVLHDGADCLQRNEAGATTVLSVPAGQDQLLLTIRRLVASGDMQADICAATSDEEQTTTILVAQRPNGTLNVPHEILLGALGLTNKEAELAQSLLNGESIGTYAQRRCMSKQTLRNQLSGILRKTKTSRQAELVGLLTRLAFAPPC